MKNCIKSKIFKLFYLLTGLLPLVSYAQLDNSDIYKTDAVFKSGVTAGEGRNFKDFVNEILGVINLIFPILITIAFIVFFWGVSRFVLNSGNQQEREKGKKFLLWGTVALFVLLSFRGIIAFMVGEFGFGVSTIDGVLLPGKP